MNYSVAIEEEGYLDEKAEVSWKKAGDEWLALGARQVPTTWGPVIRLNEEEKLYADSIRLAKQLDEELAPGVREAIRQERIAKLTPKERAALELPEDKVTDQATYHARNEAQMKTAVTHKDVADRAPEAVRAKAHKVAQQAIEAATVSEYIDRYRQNVSFEYWRTRCQVEQMHNTVQARKHIFAAQKLTDQVEFSAARAEFEKAWDLWAVIMDENPGLLDQLTSDDLFDHIKKYAELLAQLDVRFPADFKLRPLIDKDPNLPDEVKRLFDPATPKPPVDTKSRPTADRVIPATDDKGSKPEASTADPAKPVPTKSDSAKDDPAKDDPTKSDSAKPDPAKSEPTATDSPKADLNKDSKDK